MSKVSVLCWESFRPEYLHPKCPLFPGWYNKHSCAGTTELNNLRENANYIEIISLMKKVRFEKKTGMDTVSFEKKIQD